MLDTWQRGGLAAEEFASLVNVSKHTLYTWKKNFDEHGPAGLMNAPRGGRKGSRLPEVTKRAIMMIKEANPDFGCRRISDMLLRGPSLPASPGAVATVLHEAGYELEEVPTRAHKEKVRSFERAKPNQLWQTDHLLHLVLHHTWHYYKTDLRTFVDLSEVTRMDGLDRDAIIGRACARGLRTALFYSLSMAKGFLGAPIPAEVLHAVRPWWLRRKYLDRFLDTRAPLFYRFTEHAPSKARWFVSMPIVDSPLRCARFAALLLGLRVADRLAALG